MNLYLLPLLLAGLCYTALAYDEKPVFPEEALDESLEQQHYPSSCCAQAGKISSMYYNSGKWVNVFVDRKFSCKGKVFKWIFFAKKSATMYFTVWRPSAKGEWKFVGKNKVKVKLGKPGPRIWRVFVDPKDQISVEKNDVIGLQYPRKDSSEDKPRDRGVVPYNNTDNFPWTNPRGMGAEEHKSGPKCPKGFSRLINIQTYDQDLGNKVTYKDFRFFCRKAAFAACIKKKPKPPKTTPKPTKPPKTTTKPPRPPKTTPKPTRPPSPCKPNPCKNGGTCHACDRCKYECQCRPCYSGRNCEMVKGG